MDTATLTCGAVYTRLDAAPDVVRFVRDLLTVENPKAFGRYHTRQVHFLHRPKNQLLTGLVPRVVRALRAEGVAVTWTLALSVAPLGHPLRPDLRDPEDPSRERVLDPHQRASVARALRAKRLVVQIPTAGRKTEVGAEWVRRLNRPTLWLVDRTSLLHQTRERLTGELDGPVGLIGAGEFLRGGVTVASVPTLYRYVDDEEWRAEFWPYWEALVVDECHRATAGKAWLPVLAACNRAFYRLGLSATPRRRGDPVRNLRLEGVLGPIYVGATSAELEAQQIVAPTEVRWLSVAPESFPTYEAIREEVCPGAGGAGRRDWARWRAALSRLGTEMYRRMYERGIVDNEARNRAFAAKALTHARRGDRVLILVTRQRHGRHFQALLGAARCRWVSGPDPEALRAQAKAYLRQAGRIVIASDIWREGVDIPEINVVAVACGGDSTIGTLQRIGRGKRARRGKVLIVYDSFDGRGGRKDYLRKHAKQRQRDYLAEGHRQVVAPV